MTDYAEQFQTILDEYTKQYPDINLVSYVSDGEDITHYISTEDLGTAIGMTLNTIVNIVNDIESTKNAGLLAVILKCIANVNLEDDSAETAMLKQISQLLNNNEY